MSTKKNKLIIGKKIGMTQIFSESIVIPVTVIQIEPVNIIKIKTEETDGYEALQIAFGNLKEEKASKPYLGIFKKLNQSVKKYIKEIKLKDISKYQVGDIIGIDAFADNEIVSVRGKTIGRGFTGTIKRWNFRRGPMAHGSKSHRITGSIGAGTTPGRVVKGKKMPGHYGNEFVSIKNLKIVKIDTEKNLLFLKGAIPGKVNNFVEIYN